MNRCVLTPSARFSDPEGISVFKDFWLSVCHVEPVTQTPGSHGLCTGQGLQDGIWAFPRLQLGIAHPNAHPIPFPGVRSQRELLLR